MKYIIYRNGFGLSMTTEENYNARIMDANKVTNLDGFANAEEARDWMCDYYKDNPENYKIVD